MTKTQKKADDIEVEDITDEALSAQAAAAGTSKAYDPEVLPGDEWENARHDFWIPKEPGEILEGYVHYDTGTVNTEYGEADVMQVGKMQVIVSSGLFISDLCGKYIRIVFKGDRPSKRRKGKDYKAYDVYVNKNKKKLTEDELDNVL